MIGLIACVACSFGVVNVNEVGTIGEPVAVTMAPAQWIWMPCERTLANTFVLFRRELELKEAPVRATGWITADSRYRLSVNGKQVQWGPAPCDPRHLDVDPFDITALLKPGKNVIGAEVLFYGLGDGTWPAGKPGFIFNGTIEYADGRKESVVSDEAWKCMPDRAHPPGHYKRWYLRALQEEFDARLHPYGWDTAEGAGSTDSRSRGSATPPNPPLQPWLAAAIVPCPADKPPACGYHDSNDLIDRADPEKSSLRARQIPLTKEVTVKAKRLAETGRVTWLRDPDDWFDFRMKDSFRAEKENLFVKTDDGWELPATPGERDGVFATFEFDEHVVGWPYFVIDAPAGTIIELLPQESHDLEEGPAFLDTHFYSWTRFVCNDAPLNFFETFDYESCRWVQLHIRNASRPVTIRTVGIRRRLYDWPQQPNIVCDMPDLQRLFDATVNTVYNSAIDAFVDGMGRERQQYSGDCGPQAFVARYVLGDTLLSRRYLRTFSEGQSPEGYFMDCWPAFDRLARVMQKQIDGAYWGPLLDHGVGFNFDCWWYYLDTADLEGVKEAYPRLLKFAAYLESIMGEDGLLPVENLGIPTVWMDHEAFKKPRHKQCSFNLYAAAMFKHALMPLCRAMGDVEKSVHFGELGNRLRKATTAKYWSEERRRFEDNLPWQAEEGEVRLSDRSLATSVLYDQCPQGATEAALAALADCPAEMGVSYPANAHWRYWALARGGRTDVIVKDWHERWATMPSVVLNNTLQENWTVRADGTQEWSHCPVSPAFVLFTDIAGIRPTAPGFAKFTVRPQLKGFGRLALTYHTVRGPIEFTAEAEGPGHRVTVSVPEGCEAELVSPNGMREKLAAGVNRVLVAGGG